MKQLLQRLGLFVRRWQVYFRIRAELDTYSERQLRDIGIMPGDIERVAREAAGLAKPTGLLGRDARLNARPSHI